MTTTTASASVEPATVELRQRWRRGRRQWFIVMACACACGSVESANVHTDYDRAHQVDGVRATHVKQWPTCPHRAGLPVAPRLTPSQPGGSGSPGPASPGKSGPSGHRPTNIPTGEVDR